MDGGFAGVLKVNYSKRFENLEVFKLSSITRGRASRNSFELKKSYKYYFIDNGIRNAVIQNFSPMYMRNDSGALWENYCISERMKYVRYVDFFRQLYFWSTYDGSEIDLIEQTDEKINAYDIKMGKQKKHRFSKSFIDTYKPKQAKTINPDTIHDFLAGECC